MNYENIFAIVYENLDKHVLIETLMSGFFLAICKRRKILKLILDYSLSPI